HFDRHAAFLASCRLTEDPDYPVVAGLDQSLKLIRPPLEVLGPVAHELDESFAPPIAPRPREATPGYPLGVGGNHRGIKRRAEIAVLQPFLEGVQYPAHDLHVLLRHRLLRKPGGFEGLGPVRVELPTYGFPVAERDRV